MADVPASQAQVEKALMLGGIFATVDGFVSVAFFGSLVVQYISYILALPRLKERVWQQWSVFSIVFLSAVQALANVFRIIIIDVTNYGDGVYANTFRRRPIPTFVYFVGLTVIALSQLLIRQRTVRLRKSIWIGPPNRIQRSYTLAASFIQPTAIAAAVASYSIVLKTSSTYSDIVREVLRPKMPAFLVLQIVFHIGCLSLSLIKTFAIAYDVTEAKRNTLTSHPNGKKTWDVLRDLWKTTAKNSIIVLLAHCCLLVGLFHTGSSVVGRPCCSLNAVYAHSLLSQILQPQYTRKRQRFEDAMTDGDLPHHAQPTRKHLFGLGLKRKLRPARSKATSTPAATGGAAGAAVVVVNSSGSGDDGGITRTIEVHSYVNREEDFLPRSPDIEGGGGGDDDADDDWVRTRDRIGYGHACWVSTGAGPTSSTGSHGPPAGVRALTPQSHYLAPGAGGGRPASHPSIGPSIASSSRTPSPSPSSAPSPSLDGPRPPSGARSTTSGDTPLLSTSFFQRRPSTSPQRSALARSSRTAAASSAAVAHAHARRRSVAKHRTVEREDDRELAFVQSFPTGPVTSTAYEAYDPDLLDSLDLPPFALAAADNPAPTAPGALPTFSLPAVPPPPPPPPL